MRRRQQNEPLLPRRGRGVHTTLNFNCRRLWHRISGNRINLIMLLIIIALVPPFFFHFRLTRFHQGRTRKREGSVFPSSEITSFQQQHYPMALANSGMQMKKCGWLASPPLVCAHGGDSINAFPNTMAVYRNAIHARLDCIEIDVSRSSDGFLFALHDRDLQRISGNYTARVGLWSKKEINELDAALHFPGVLDDQKVPTVEDALTLVSNSVRRVILDAKVGPPLYEKGLAEDILAVVKRSNCLNCIVWAKSDPLVRDITRLSPDTMAGYIIMKDPSTGYRSNVLRMKRAEVAGVYHPLIDEKLIKILRGRSKKIYAWTVDDMISMRDMLSNNVDAVVTSNPRLLQQVMDDTRIQCLEEGFSLP